VIESNDTRYDVIAACVVVLLVLAIGGVVALWMT
jgi:hypothetical protein